MRHLQLSKVLGGRLTITSKLRGVEEYFWRSFGATCFAYIKNTYGEYKDVQEFKKVSKPLKFCL